MELGSKIVRPVVSIVHFGMNRTTYSVTSPGWSNEYQRRKTFNNIHETKKIAKVFVEYFDSLAIEIESGKERPYGIMRMFVQHGVFNSVRKLNVNTDTI